jgi:hypothetical protein
MKVIYKYPLRLQDEQVINMHHAAKPLMVAEQRGTLNIWAEVQPTGETKAGVVSGIPADTVTVYIRGTGQEIPKNVTYLGSVVTLGGTFVWHVYYTYGG